jgi:FtsH-binding integral membrane protein
MLKSRKFVIWLVSLLIFISIILLELFLKRENLYISELGIALGIISGTYQTSNIFQKKFTHDKLDENIRLPKT